MKVKFTFEIRIVQKNSLALMGHHTGLSMYPKLYFSLLNNTTFYLYKHLLKRTQAGPNLIALRNLSIQL